MYENKKILIVGAAKSGISVAKLLANRNNDITITDLNDIDEYNKQLLKSLNIKIVITNNQVDLLNKDWDLIIKNPAIMYTSNIVKRCKELNLHVENEMEVAYHFLPKNITIIGVTGSNGKTTTTTMIYELLKLMKRPVVLGGNIGYPLSEVIPLIHEGDILLLEISDHQLINFNDFKTNISVLTNLCQTHLDYHGTYENYKKVKHNIFNHHTKGDIAIINAGNEDSMILTSDINSTKEYFNGKDAYVKDNAIYIEDEKIIDTKDILVKGKHNYENIMACLLVIKEFGIDKEIIKKFFSTFKGVEHRIEFVCEKGGVKYYNDSKATNPTSTITALNAFEEDTYLILGGMERCQDFHELDNAIKNVKKIYAIGQTTEKVYEYAQSMNILCEKCYTLNEAMNKIKNDNIKKGVVLLSPASASWDQYDKFETRGEEFKNIAKSM